MYLLIVSGLSGAGKSTCLNCLEEQGYYCVDNLPSDLLKEFVSICSKAIPPIRKAAVTIDSRESLLSHTTQNILNKLDNVGIPYEVLFLDARDDILRKRYNESRRRHPLGDAGDAFTGVQRERIFLEPIRTRAAYVLDTSDIKAKDLYRTITHVLPEYENKEMTVIFSSFGYKRGVPIDADFVLDTRFVPNPFYVEGLKQLSGMDSPVSDYVFSFPEAVSFADAVEKMIRQFLPHFLEQDKHIVRVCFGCTGGRHRSVAFAEKLAGRFRYDNFNVRVYHRDIYTEAEEISKRSK